MLTATYCREDTKLENTNRYLAAQALPPSLPHGLHTTFQTPPVTHTPPNTAAVKEHLSLNVGYSIAPLKSGAKDRSLGTLFRES